MFLVALAFFSGSAFGSLGIGNALALGLDRLFSCKAFSLRGRFFGPRVEFDRDRLTSAVKRVALLSNERSRAVKFEINKGKVEVTSSSSEPPFTNTSRAPRSRSFR